MKIPVLSVDKLKPEDTVYIIHRSQSKTYKSPKYYIFNKNFINDNYLFIPYEGEYLPNEMDLFYDLESFKQKIREYVDINSQ